MTLLEVDVKSRELQQHLRSVPPLTARSSDSFLLFHHKHTAVREYTLTQCPEEVVASVYLRIGAVG